MTDPGESWAAWLREQFDNHPTIRTPAELTRAAGQKPNGRPVVDASSVTQWLRGRRPSFRLVVATAQAFGRPADEALRAAGYAVDVETKMYGPGPEPQEQPDDLRSRIAAAPELDGYAKDLLVTIYDREVERVAADRQRRDGVRKTG